MDDIHKPRYLKIAERIRSEVRAKRYCVGEKIPSRQALARQFGTTLVTVDRAMRVLLDEGVVYSENGRGTFVADATSLPAGAGQTLTLAVIIPARERHLGMSFLSGASAALRRADAQLAYYESEHRPDVEAEQIRRALEHGVAGILLHPVLQASNLALYQEVGERGVPLVFLNLSFAGFEGDCVSVDNFAEARRAVEHLIALGHRRIAHLTYPGGLLKPLIYRALGYEAALKVNDIAFDPALVATVNAEAEGKAALDRWLTLPDPPTAVFAVSDRWMLVTLEHLQERGVRVPEQMSVVGILNGPEIAADFARFPAPTGVVQSLSAMGETAAEIAAGKATGAIPFAERQEVVLPAQFVIGASCASR